MYRAREPTFQSIDVIIHTEREVGVQRRHKIGEHLPAVVAVTAQELRISHQLHGVVPSFGSLQTQFPRIAYEVFRGFEIVQGVAFRGDEAQLQFQFIVPLHLLFVVVIELQRDGSHHRIVAFAAFVPIA